MLKWILALVVIVGGCNTPPSTKTNIRIVFPENAEKPEITLDTQITWKG